jgi:hypothetical protein
MKQSLEKSHVQRFLFVDKCDSGGLADFLSLSNHPKQIDMETIMILTQTQQVR